MQRLPLLSRRRTLSISLLFILIMASILTTSVLPVYAVPNIYMTPSVNPPTPEPYVGFKWNVTLWITGYGAPPVFAWQVKLFYDPAAGINVTRAWNAEDDPSYIFTGKTTVPVVPFIQPGTVLVGSSLLGAEGVTPGPDPAKLAIIEFRIVKAPARFETLSTDLDITNADTYLLDNTLETIAPITTTNGSYTWAWTPPTVNPNVAVHRADGQPWPLEFGSSPPPTGQTFSVNVAIENLDAEWGLIEANVTIAYNATVIDIVGGVANVTINSSRWTVTSLAINYNTDPTLDNITIHVKPISPWVPNGTVLVATIIFTVVYAGPWGIDVISPLDFIESVLDAGPALIPQNPPVNGKVVIRGLTIEVRLPPHTPGANQYITNKLETFNVEVWLNDVTSGKNVTGVEFRLPFNDTLLTVLDVTEGPFFKQFNQTPNEIGQTIFISYIVLSAEDDPLYYALYGPHMLIGIILLPDEQTSQYYNFPRGSGMFATITFQGIYRGFYPEENNFTLKLVEVSLSDDKGKTVVASPIDGYYEILSYRSPVAAFTYSPSVLNATVPVLFNASNSSDFNLGYIVNYTWDFGDGNTTPATQPVIRHVYMVPGTYSVNLTITDDDGQTNSTAESLTVAKLTSTISIAVAPSIIVFSQSTTISGTISPARAAVDVTIQYRLQGETEWQTLITTPTDTEGKYSYAWTPTDVGTYELVASWPGDGITDFASSDTFVLVVNNLGDIAIVNVSLSETTIYPGWPVRINITVKNEGMVNATFDVLVYYNDTNLVANETVTDLAPSAEITLSFVWDTTDAIESKNYVISAIATIVSNELDTADNTFVYGYVKIKISGDVTGDNTVDNEDLQILSDAFGSYGPDYLYPGSPPHPRWDPRADVNNDNKVDLLDLAMGPSNFGKTSPT